MKKKRPLIPRSDGTFLVPLSRGMFAVVDAIDAEDVSRFNWCVLWSRGKHYVQRKVGGRKNKQTILLHRQLLGFPSGKEIDHVDGNPMNNTRSNLRVVSHAENMRNIRWRNRFASSDSVAG